MLLAEKTLIKQQRGPCASPPSCLTTAAFFKPQTWSSTCSEFPWLLHSCETSWSVLLFNIPSFPHHQRWDRLHRLWCHESGPFHRRVFPFSGEWSQLKAGNCPLRSSLFHTEDQCCLFKIWVICGCTDLLILLGVRKSELRKATNSFSLINGSLIFYSTFC